MFNAKASHLVDMVFRASMCITTMGFQRISLDCLRSSSGQRYNNMAFKGTISVLDHMAH